MKLEQVIRLATENFTKYPSHDFFICPDGAIHHVNENGVVCWGQVGSRYSMNQYDIASDRWELVEPIESDKPFSRNMHEMPYFKKFIERRFKECGILKQQDMPESFKIGDRVKIGNFHGVITHVYLSNPVYDVNLDEIKSVTCCVPAELLTKIKPSLKVGDEVMLRGKIIEIDDDVDGMPYLVEITDNNGLKEWFTKKSLTKVEKE